MPGLRALLTMLVGLTPITALGCDVDRKNPGNVEYGGHDGRTMEPGRDAAAPVEACSGDAGAPDDRGDAGRGGPPAGITIHEAGDTMTSVSPRTRFAALLAGGGKDSVGAMTGLVDAGGRGDVVILRMDDTGGAYPPYFVKRGAHGATEIIFDAVGGDNTVSGGALAALRARSDDPWILRKVDEAEVVFLAGGNQTKYVDAWRETKLAAAINRLIARGGAIGGTSAGMHALAGVVHTPRGPGNSVTSAAALADPYIGESEHAGTRSLTLEAGPFALPLFANVVTDTHWSQRARRGRSLVFLARILADGARPLGDVALLACDEGIGVLFDATGVGRVFGPPTGAAFMFRPDGPPDRCVDNQTLDWPAGVPYLRVEGSEMGVGTLDLGSPVGPARDTIVNGVIAP